MFIKNQKFKDDDTLEEVLFDFELGEETEYISDIKKEIEQALAENESFQEYRKTLQGEDREELDDEERRIRLSETLQERFDSFEVKDRKMYGIKGDERVLLYTVDLV